MKFSFQVFFLLCLIMPAGGSTLVESSVLLLRPRAESCQEKSGESARVQFGITLNMTVFWIKQVSCSGTRQIMRDISKGKKIPQTLKCT